MVVRVGDERVIAERSRDEKAARLFEPELRAAADGLDLTVTAEQYISGRGFFVTDRTGRRMRVSHAIRKWFSLAKLRAILAAFAEGATEIKWTDGTTFEAYIEPETRQNEVQEPKHGIT